MTAPGVPTRGSRRLWTERVVTPGRFLFDLASLTTDRSEERHSVSVDATGVHVVDPPTSILGARELLISWTDIVGVVDGEGDELARIALRDGSDVVLGPAHAPRGPRKRSLRRGRLAALHAVIEAGIER